MPQKKHFAGYRTTITGSKRFSSGKRHYFHSIICVAVQFYYICNNELFAITYSMT